MIFNNFPDQFPSGEIGKVPAFDADVTDKLTYKILSGNNANLVRLNSSSGSLTLSPQLNTNVPKFAVMEVSVSDGINEAKAIMTFVVRLITEDMLFNSVTVRLEDMTEEAFLSPLLNFFLDGLAAIIPCPKENIYLFSIQEDTDINARVLNISFSARRSDVSHEEFYTSQYLQERVYLNRAILARLATVQVLPFDDNLCVREPCLNYEECLTVLKFGNASGFIHSDTVLFRPIYPVNTFACKCPEGFTGSKEHYLCDTEVDLCYSDPCANGGNCVRREGGYTCVCSPEFTGINCETRIDSLPACATDHCEGGSCHHNKVPLHPSYTSTCELRSRSFSKNSFLTFPSLRQRHRFNIKLNFSTIVENGLLLYNGRYNELHDFIALEVLNGKISFSFSLGKDVKSVSIDQEAKVSDGFWHTIEVSYFNRSVTISLDSCDTALLLNGDLGEKWNCANHTTLTLDKKCSSLTETCHRFLDLTGPLQIGGLPRIPGHFPIQSHDFVGCISDIYIDRKYVDLNSYVADNGTTAGCPAKILSCASEPCFNGATCHEGWGTHICDCPEGYTGHACQEKVVAPWRFSGNGLLSFNPLLRQIQYPWLTALSVRTRQRNAFLIQIQVGQNSSAVISLKNGVLHYSYNERQMQLSGINLADGRWHRIEVKWHGSEITFSVDYGQRSRATPIFVNIQGFFVGRIILGSADSSFGKTEDLGHFEGCIQDIRVGGPQSTLNRPTIRENVADGCDSGKVCVESCFGHSSCVADWDESTCECLPGYVGDDCVPVCTINPCSSGVCRVDQSDHKGYRCDCLASNNTGEYCEMNRVQPCPGGWWGEKVCGPCKCNVKQGYHMNCNKSTGQCYCKENHFQPVNETACLPCDCYAVGSYSGKCNTLTGQCECREGVIGRRCDSCSNPYAEVTLKGCEVVYDSCPRSFAAGTWWPRTPLGQISIENCPTPAFGKGSRVCDRERGGWGHPDMFNCTSQPFIDLRKRLSQMEKGELELNSFISVKMASSLQHATEIVGNINNSVGGEKRPADGRMSFKLTPVNKDAIWLDEYEMEYLSDEVKFVHDRLYGADILVCEGILHELIIYELTQNGLNLSHSQDKYFIKNLVDSASVILDERYAGEWKRVHELTQRKPSDLVDAFNKYMTILARSQHDTYTNPFEIVHKNLVFGLDIVTVESLFGYQPQQLTKEYQKEKKLQSNQFTTESVVLPDTSSFLQHPPKQKPMISFPKYNNYMQNKNKFDHHTKVLVPLDMLGIASPDGNEVTHAMKEHRAIISYAQYKDMGVLYDGSYDETVTRRWGVDIKIATPILSLTILVPSAGDPPRPNGNNNINTNVYDDHPTKVIVEHIDGYHVETTVETDSPVLKDNHNEQIKISVHDMEEHGSLENSPEIKIHNPSSTSVEQIEDVDDENLESATEAKKGIDDDEVTENESVYGDKRLVKRQTTEEDEQQLIYRSLGSPHLSQPIKLQMWLNIDRNAFGPRSNPQCVRWNSFTNSWTRLGCQTQIPNYEAIYFDDGPIIVNCSCSHISNYAVLIDVIDPNDIPEPSLLIQITTCSAFLISLPILFLVLVALALLRGLQTNSNTIHQNLVLCVFFAELLFFIGFQSRRHLVDTEFSCKIIAICLHYAWLAAFAWTTVDCVHLYRMLTEMRDVNHGPMGFYFSMGYGAPAIVVGLSVGVRAHEYGNNML